MSEPNYVALRWAHRTRRRAVWMRNKAQQVVRSQLRTMVGWRRDLPEAERKTFRDLADACWKALRRQEPFPAEAPNLVRDWRPSLEMLTAPYEQYEALRVAVEAPLVAEAEKLPVWPWAQAIRNFGALSLGQIVAETGPLDRFPTPEKLRGYLRLRPEGGKALVRGRAAATVWVATNPLILGNVHYKAIYDAAKAKSLANPAHADWVNRDGRLSKAHHHNHAHRVMEQTFLDDLWVAWQEAVSPAEPSADADAA